MPAQMPAVQQQAEDEAARLPEMLAQADMLAANVLLGSHGRRRPGQGDDFWQYRPVHSGDNRRDIDWRRSARSDTEYLREREWQVAQSVHLWVDRSVSMRFASNVRLPQKSDRACLIALAAAILLDRGGERVGLTGSDLLPRRGRAQILRIAEALSAPDSQEFAAPVISANALRARGIFVSDCLGPLAPIEQALTRAADQGMRGVLMQVLDPAEAEFPYAGRTVFQSVGKSLQFETRKADDLKTAYLSRLADRQDALRALCRATGWQFHCHLTSQSVQAALLWLHAALDRGQ